MFLKKKKNLILLCVHLFRFFSVIFSVTCSLSYPLLVYALFETSCKYALVCFFFFLVLHTWAIQFLSNPIPYKTANPNHPGLTCPSQGHFITCSPGSRSSGKGKSELVSWSIVSTVFQWATVEFRLCWLVVSGFKWLGLSDDCSWDVEVIVCRAWVSFWSTRWEHGLPSQLLRSPFILSMSPAAMAW